MHWISSASNWLQERNIPVLFMEQHFWHSLSQTGQWPQDMSRLAAACLSAELALVLWQPDTFHFSFEIICDLQSWQGQGVKNLSVLQFILVRAHTNSAQLDSLIPSSEQMWGYPVTLLKTQSPGEIQGVCTKSRVLPKNSFHLVIAEILPASKILLHLTGHQQSLMLRETSLC